MHDVLLKKFIKQPEKLGAEFCWRLVKPAKKVLGAGWLRTHGIPGFNKRVLRTLARASCPSNRASFKRFLVSAVDVAERAAPQTRRVSSRFKNKLSMIGEKF